MEDYNVLKNKPEMLTLFLKDKLKRYVQVELQVDRKKKQPSVDLPKGPDTEPVKAPPFQGPILFADMRGQDGEVGDGIYQLPDEDLPGMVKSPDEIKFDDANIAFFEFFSTKFFFPSYPCTM